MNLVVRKRTFYGVSLWWIGSINENKCFVVYSDIHAPTGYGFSSKTKAEKVAMYLEENRKKDCSP